jgi:uncharacterized Rossmann fold enzyme
MAHFSRISTLAAVNHSQSYPQEMWITMGGFSDGDLAPELEAQISLSRLSDHSV